MMAPERRCAFSGVTDCLLDATLIQVPYHAGDDRHGSSEGPRELLARGAGRVLSDRGLNVTVQEVRRGGSFRDTATSAAEINRLLAACVASADRAGSVPIILTGSCDSCLGVLGGFGHASCGVVWIDAHADYNTPESTASGFFPGMASAIVTGHCYRSYWAEIGDSSPVPEAQVCLLGTRDLSPAMERERLDASAIEVVGWDQGGPRTEPTAALDRVLQQVDDVYLHIDFDGFAPDVAPGVADEPVPGGLSFEDARAIIDRLSPVRLRAVTLATYTPARDVGGRTAQLGLKLLDVIGQQLVA